MPGRRSDARRPGLKKYNIAPNVNLEIGAFSTVRTAVPAMEHSGWTACEGAHQRRLAPYTYF
jgi:hypothetical protein